jgi:hypothetical protein
MGDEVHSTGDVGSSITLGGGTMTEEHPLAAWRRTTSAIDREVEPGISGPSRAAPGGAPGAGWCAVALVSMAPP